MFINTFSMGTLKRQINTKSAGRTYVHWTYVKIDIPNFWREQIVVLFILVAGPTDENKIVWKISALTVCLTDEGYEVRNCETKENHN